MFASTPTRRERLAVLAERVRPAAPSRTRLLPAPPAIASLLPDGGLRRGTALRCSGAGALSLALAVASGPSAVGCWCAVMGEGDLGALAAAGYGVRPERLAVVRVAPAQWALAAGILIDGIDLVVAVPPRHLRPATAKTITARARERGAVLVVVEEGASWPVEVELAVTEAGWHGLAQGAGRLQARRVTVVARGRGSAVRPVRQELWLPTATGKVAGA